MSNRVITRVILHSAKNRTFIGLAPFKFRGLFSGTPNQQNYVSDKPIASPPIPPFQSYNASEAIKIAVQQKQLEPGTAGQIRKIFSQIPHFLEAKGLYEQQVKKKNSYPVQNSLLKDTGECSICSLDDLVRSKSFQSFTDHDNFDEANCCLSPTILQLLRDVVSQLAVLHKIGIVHGDINPDNISIHQGQRLFAKLANVDRKPLEQVHHGSKTLATDLFSLGCVIEFCVALGSYPFGDILAQSQKGILEKKLNLTRAKYLPEAFHLICKLLMPPQYHGLKAIDVLSHPLFWSPRKRVAFLRSFNKELLIDISCYDQQSRAMYSPMSSRTMRGTWAEEIGSVKLSCTSYEGLLKSLQFLRDMNIYYAPVTQLGNGPPNDFEPFDDTEAPLHRIVNDYYARHYPWLLIYLYAIARQFGDLQVFVRES